jgi:hypothetical protein
VSAAGLVPVLELAEQCGLSELLREHLTIPSPNRAVKARTVIAGLLAGADDIDGLDLLRAGGMKRVVAGVRAPSTVGTFLRKAAHGHVLQLGAVNRGLLEGLACHVPFLVGSSNMALIDLDDTIRDVHGYQKQGAATHKTDAINDWLARHPQFHVHFTPIGASWVNQVERWFGVITEKLIRRGVQTSVPALEADIRNWINTYNDDLRPFQWT